MSFVDFNEPGATEVTGAVPDTINASTATILDPTSTTNLLLTIGGTDRNAYIASGTLTVELATQQRGSMRFELIDEAKSYRPSIGEPVVLTNNGVTLFSGTLYDYKEDWPVEEGRRVLRLTCQCVDKAQSLDRRFVSVDFDVQLRLVTLVNNILIYNNIPVTDLKGAVSDTTVTLPSGFRVTMVPLKQAIDKATQAVGYTWWVSEEGQLVMRDPSAAPIDAPYALADTESKFGDLTIGNSLEEYANRIIVRTEAVVAQTYTESFTADGSTTQFFVSQPISSVLSVTEDAVAKTVGTITGDYFSGNLKDWYYEPDETIDIQTLAPRSPVANGVVIEVTYKGPTSNLVISEDITAQAARAAVEGNSGIYEMLIDDAKHFADETAAQAYADKLLAKHKQIPQTCLIKSRYNGWRPGQTVTATLGDANLSAVDFFVERVTIRDDNYKAGEPFRLIYEIEGSTITETFGGSGDVFFETLVEMARGGSDPQTVAAISDPPLSSSTGGHVAIFNYAEGLGSGTETLSTGDDKTIRRALRFGATTAEMELTEVFAFVTTAPTGAAINFDIRYIDESGDDQGTIFSSTASIAADASSVTITSFLITKIRHGGFLVLDLDQVGSTNSGARLGVYVSGTPL